MTGLWALAKSWLVPLLLSVFAVGGGFGLGYWAGDHNRNNAWLAKQAKVERQAKADYEAEVKRGNDASGAFLVEHQAMQSNFQNLTEKFNGLSKRVPLVVAGRPDACSTRADRVDAQRSPKLQPGPQALDGSEPAGAASPVLTAGAVWMWNSALTGTDQPAGACGSLDTTEAACAAATTATIDDAWANHKTNAQLCAEDRLAHQHLIDFLPPRKPQ